MKNIYEIVYYTYKCRYQPLSRNNNMREAYGARENTFLGFNFSGAIAESLRVPKNFLRAFVVTRVLKAKCNPEKRRGKKNKIIIARAI